MKILVLGGTTEARHLCGLLADAGLDEVTVSLAGRTRDPAPYPAHVLTGGFGGAEGLANYLAAQGIRLLVDATHPFAGTMSAHAEAAARLSGVTTIRLARPGWEAQAGDRWQIVDSLDAAAEALGGEPKRVFLAVGRQSVAPFRARPQHHYLIRSVEPVEGLDRFPLAENLLARGPFDEASELDLLKSRAIDVVVTKNSGGEATSAKLAAARTLGLPVILVNQPGEGSLPSFGSVEEVMAEIGRIRRSAGY